MARFIKGDIVVIPFPFSDLTETKRRPALVITGLEGNDLILSQITSQTIKDKYSILITDADFERGSLKQASNIRPNRLFTIDSKLVLYKIGKLKSTKLSEVIEKLIEIIRN